MSNLIPEATRIVDGSAPLYLGAVASARSAGPLRAANIKSIVDLTAKGVDHEGVRHKGIRYLHIDVADVPAAAIELGGRLPSITAFIAKARAAGSGVLVHCHYGKVRTAHSHTTRAHTQRARERGGGTLCVVNSDICDFWATCDLWATCTGRAAAQQL